MRLARSVSWIMGTFIPQWVPFGEEALFQLHTFGIRRALELRGTPVGHAAGSGDLTKEGSPGAKIIENLPEKLQEAIVQSGLRAKL